MSTYKNLRGKRIKFFTSDLSNTQAEGQVFYSDTDSEYKVAVASGAWSAGSNLGTARSRAGGTLGSDSTQSAGMAFGGQNSTGLLNLNEEYNGSGWSAGGALNTARR